jgi:DNA glycosylase AlkZ-like
MLAALDDEVVEVAVDGQRAWVLAWDVDDMVSAKSPNEARLLPAFDPWVSARSIRRRNTLCELTAHAINSS